MTEYTPGFITTPGEKRVSVLVSNPAHEIRQNRRTFKVPLLDESGIRVVGECAKDCIEHDRDCMILWTGKRGGGKSTCILKTGLYIDPKLDENSVAYWLEDITRLFAENKQGDASKNFYPQIISDETGYALHSKQWQTRAQIEYAKNMIINRIMRQIFHVAVPNKMQCNNEIRDMAFMWVHVSEPKYFQPGYAVVRLAPPEKQSEFFSTSFWEPKFAFIFTDLSGELWDRYEAKKMDFVREASLKTSKDGSPGSDKHSVARDALIKEYYQYRKIHGDPITCEGLSKIAGIGKSMVWNVLNDIKH